jgi:hypothetical protein
MIAAKTGQGKMYVIPLVCFTRCFAMTILLLWCQACAKPSQTDVYLLSARSHGLWKIVEGVHLFNIKRVNGWQTLLVEIQ